MTGHRPKTQFVRTSVTIDTEKPVPEDRSPNLTPAPHVLAIETSQRAGGVAVRDGEGVIHVEDLSPHKRHDDDLIPAIDRICNRLQFVPKDLTAVGVSVGPGGFTGVRIAVSTAKMLAESLKIKLLAVPTACVVAESLDKDGSILVALASKKESAWCAQLERNGDEWMITNRFGVVGADTLDLSGIRTVIADEYFPDAMRKMCVESEIVIHKPQFDPRSCLIVAERMLLRGETMGPLDLLPIYARPPEAVSLWKRRGRQ